MSYYMGDYYVGDPGFFSGIAGLASKAIGFLPGPAQGIASKIVSGIGSIGARKAGGAAATAGSRLAPVLKGAGQLALKHPVLTGAGAAGLVGTAGAVAGRLTAPPGAPMHGFHLSRKTGKLVRNRHMKVTNPKALRRALRRAYGFERLAMKTIRLLHPKKHARFGGFKHRRKARV